MLYHVENRDTSLKTIRELLKKGGMLCCTTVGEKDYPCDLRVSDPDAIYDYVYSYPGNASVILNRKGDRFRKLIEERLTSDGSFFIHKETGIFTGYKA